MRGAPFRIYPFKKKDTFNLYVNRGWSPFFTWFTSTILLLWGAYYAYTMDAFMYVYSHDVTYITSVILAVLTIGVIRIGQMNYRWSKKEYYEEPRVSSIERKHVWDDGLVQGIRKHIDDWKFVSDILVYGGLIGTLIGFSITFGVIASAAAANPGGLTAQVVLQLIPSLIKPIGTVFFPTIYSLIGLVVLKVQIKMFESFSGIDDVQYEEQRNDPEQ